jgi:Fic family protein
MQNRSILFDTLLPEYQNLVSRSQLTIYEELKDSELSMDTFSFYTSVAAVFSSKIEGEDIQLDSYIKHKRFGVEFLPDYTKKIDDLYEAYTFAKSNPLNEQNINVAHQLLTRNILSIHRQGKIRTSNLYVTTDDGRIEYIAANPCILATEMKKFYQDLDFLLRKDMDLQEVFYYASLLHLVFVKIHPFEDGNGRTARLVEKWFLASKLGQKAWLINSEKNYYAQHATYYQNIRQLGLEYELLDYSKAVSFLTMLPQALKV